MPENAIPTIDPDLDAIRSSFENLGEFLTALAADCVALGTRLSALAEHITALEVAAAALEQDQGEVLVGCIGSPEYTVTVIPGWADGVFDD